VTLVMLVVLVVPTVLLPVRAIACACVAPLAASAAPEPGPPSLERSFSALVAAAGCQCQGARRSARSGV
jgi:K+-transporting ATPase A subunit